MLPVLLLKACEPVNVTTELSIAISFALAVIPVPPTTSNVTAPVVPPPVIPAPATTEVISPVGIVATWVSTYALIDCCEATDVAESDDIVSSSLNAVPLIAVLITGLVKVGADKILLVRVSEDVLATKVSAPEGIVTVPPFVIEAIVGVVKVLFVKVCAVFLSTTTAVSIAKVIVCAEPVVSIPVPPARVSSCVVKSTDWLPPVSPSKSKSEPPTCAST